MKHVDGWRKMWAWAWLARVQSSRCAICGAPDREDRAGLLQVDHCHKSLKVRGLLCPSCNVRVAHYEKQTELGWARPSPAIDAYLADPPGHELVTEPTFQDYNILVAEGLAAYYDDGRTAIDFLKLSYR